MYDAYQRMVEQALCAVMQRTDIPEKLREAMAYSLLAGGKRLRPVLVLSAYRLVKEDVTPALPFAVALEMIHTYSLIHDDLPAMDDDSLRRGKPTNHIMYGESVAILAGDGLLHMAFETMLTASISFPVPSDAIKAMEAVARRTGVTGMVAGQTVDVTMEGNTPQPEILSYIHAHKTADLITAALEAGLKLAGASETQIEAGMSYGYHFGMAFQMVDDLLDIMGDEKVLGKKTGVDNARGKMTWPSLYGIEGTHDEARAHIDSAVCAIGAFKQNGKFLETLAKSTLQRVQ